MKTTIHITKGKNKINKDTQQYKKNKTDISTAMKTCNINNENIERGIFQQRNVRNHLVENVQ